MQCEAIIPELCEATHSEMVETAPAEYEEREAPGPWPEFLDAGSGTPVERVLITPAQLERVIHYQTTPEHRCEAGATMLARSVKQVRCDLGEPHWVKDGADRGYCAGCFRPGTVTDLAGTVSLHPAMSIDEYQEG